MRTVKGGSGTYEAGRAVNDSRKAIEELEEVRVVNSWHRVLTVRLGHVGRVMHSWSHQGVG